MKPDTYLKMIAGTLPEHGQGSVDNSLRLLAQEALGTAQVHYVRTPYPVNGKYHYLALPSAALSSELLPATELAMALPGHPAHRGPGAYVLDTGIYKIAVLFDGEQLDIIANEAELVNELLAEQDLPVIKVPAETEKWRFQSNFTRHTRLVETLTARIARFSLAALVVVGLTYAGLSAAEGWLTARLHANEETTAQTLSTALSEVRAGSPLAKQLAQYQQRMSTAVRAGGWMDAYKVEANKEHMRMFVPTWISPDYLASLGGGVTVDRDTDEQLLILIKGEPDGGKKITSAETVAKQEAPEMEAPTAPPAARK